ncbi:MAG: putative 4-hydroxybenzoate polyprenyltransferase [Candidatus Pseudobacter hemicellulosilyticus]|uniref:4-hydroxybenzoate polyprenyltransferase n=1 Tax=Candidatus Pseudobacter hemicellulosilyticus TaxID=3121375 RepID=A0AAJ5WR70_9BACT|nr:MAG: putative 4-hydroxybenzoate polyprenyltransferase [Pseudobacter sp.]
MSTVKKYLSLVKFSHTIFAMPFAMIGFFLATAELRHISRLIDYLPDAGTFSRYTSNGQPFWLTFLLVVLCMVFARSAAMAFNRWLDARFDALNPRTAIREIPAGILKADSVLLFTIGCSVLFMVCTWFINPLCFALSPVALLVVLGYSYTKRFTPLCHLVLGLGLSLAPIGAYLAVTGRFDWLPILFSFAVITWVSGFDIIYALQDEQFDKSQQLYSMPSWLGGAKALRVSEILHVISTACVVIAGIYGHFHWLYWIGVAVFAGMLLYQHSIVKPTDLRRVNLAFMTANGIASVVFAVFVIADLFLLPAGLPGTVIKESFLQL